MVALALLAQQVQPDLVAHRDQPVKLVKLEQPDPRVDRLGQLVKLEQLGQPVVAKPVQRVPPAQQAELAQLDLLVDQLVPRVLQAQLDLPVDRPVQLDQLVRQDLAGEAGIE
jgi:hypothetical protein